MDVKFDTHTVNIGLPGNMTSKEVKVVNACHLLDKIYGLDGWLNLDYDDMGSSIAKWCYEKGAFYYSAPRDEFSTYAACVEALAAGKNIVVVEDLS